MNLKYCSAIFCQDDAFDTDQGYTGNLQFVFALLGADGHHAAEMDSKQNKVNGSPTTVKTPRSYPRMSHATFIGGADGMINSGHDDEPGLMMLREGTGGEFSNIVLSHGNQHGVFMVSVSALPPTHSRAHATRAAHHCAMGAPAYHSADT